MHTIKLEVQESIYAHIIYLLSSLNKKEICILEDKKVEDSEIKEFINFSQTSLEKDWNNQEDSVYDKFL